jgi:hypothetical protein
MRVRSRSLSSERDYEVPVGYLSSLLLVDNNLNNEPVRIFHFSFPDFMTDARRSKIDSMYVNPPVDHGTLAFRCLSILN